MNQSQNLLKFSRWLLMLLVFVIWVFISLQENLIHEGLKTLSIKTIAFFNIDQNSSSSDYSLSRYTTFLYNTLYCSLCLSLIHLYFNSWYISRLTFFLYLILFVFTVSINELGKAFTFEPFRTTAYRLMTVVVSPLPIVLLIPAFHLIGKEKET